MNDRKTLKLPADDFDRHNERRKEMGLSWPEYVDGQAPDAPDVTADVGEVSLEATEYEKIGRAVAERIDADGGSGDIDGVVADLKAELPGAVADESDTLEEIADTLESIQKDWEYLNGEEIHGGVHESEHQLRDVLSRIDDLENTLPRKVAEEVRR